MLADIFDIVAPVFLVIGAGYAAAARRLVDEGAIDALMRFAIQFAVPCLLFRATATMDLGTAYDWRVMTAFYVGSTASFALAVLVGRHVYGCRAGEAVAIGFGALFSNLVLLGLPISQRAWGADSDAMAAAFAVVSVHAPYCYLLGITVMELLRADGRSLPDTVGVVLRAMFRNSLMIGIGLGFAVNLGEVPLPGVLLAAVDIVARAALPVALFALGGTLTRYAVRDSVGHAAGIASLSLLLHPAITLAVCLLLGAPADLAAAVVLLAAMAPGVNGYLFASLYARGQGVAAGSVLLGTALSILTVSAWLWLLARP